MELFSFKKSKGNITNSDLELTALVIQESVLPAIIKAPVWWTPTSGSYNTSTIAWTFKEDSTINPIIYELLRIFSSQKLHHSLSPSIFYHPGLLNTMADDVSRWFDLSPHHFLNLFHSIYLTQSPGS